ncbi:hypothetical protein WT98_17065 [Burkholderia territorii]|nr:hypothetical protein WT98_17065 [Burkholderia territorii]
MVGCSATHSAVADPERTITITPMVALDRLDKQYPEIECGTVNESQRMTLVISLQVDCCQFRYRGRTTESGGRGRWPLGDA